MQLGTKKQRRLWNEAFPSWHFQEHKCTVALGEGHDGMRDRIFGARGGINIPAGLPAVQSFRRASRGSTWLTHGSPPSLRVDFGVGSRRLRPRRDVTWSPQRLRRPRWPRLATAAIEATAVATTVLSKAPMACRGTLATEGMHFDSCNDFGSYKKK